ncbi:MAG TPA: peptidyl-tRNA hydrolase Pth2 [Thermoplasmata archaeon]|nr:peptidyl-tRNA hydrolase Pth2 [Thermoplasmata archaeon]
MPASARSPDEVKLVLVLRSDLGLSVGKTAVQAAHGAVMAAELARRSRSEVFARWLAAGQKKIAVAVPDLAALEELARAARARKLPAVTVEDAGLTEVAPGTVTCLALGPATGREVDPVTGSLPLL